ncbi:unnamed protein product, partial [marine sediment metagenome]
MLKGELVNLRAVEKKDLEEIMKMHNDQEVTKYTSAPLYPVSRAEEEKFLEKAMSHNDTEMHLAMETKEGEYIGLIGLDKIDWKNRNAELGIVIGNKEYWGKGYGTDATKILLNHAFNQMNLYKVYLEVFDYNQRGVR